MVNYVFKLIIVGEASVGKTSIIKRITQGVFHQNQNIPTLGIDMFNHSIKINSNDIRLILWDTAGSEAFRSLTHSYYRAAAGVILVFDVTNKNSFDSLTYWVEECKKYISKTTQLILFGNKSDMTDQVVVTKDEVDKFVKLHSMIYFEVSAYSGTNVTAGLMELSKNIYQKIENGEIDVRDPESGARLSDEFLKDPQLSSQKSVNNDKYMCSCG